MTSPLPLVSFNRVVLAAAVSACAGSALATPLSNEYRLTSYLANTQSVGECKKALNGDRLVLWNTGGNTPFSMIKRTDAAGAPLGPAENMNLGTDVSAIATNRVGGFVVVHKAVYGNYADLVATVYNRAGAVVVPGLRVNLNSMPKALHAKVAMSPNGGFTVVWTTYDNGTVNQLYTRRFSATGVPLSGDNLLSPGVNFELRDIATDLAGNEVLTYWTHDPGNKNELWQRRYVAAIDTYTAPTRVSYLAGRKYGGGLSMNPNGQYVITWTGADTSDSNFGLYTQWFNNDGSAGGPSVRVAGLADLSQTYSEVSLLANNSYAVTWNDYTATGNFLKTRLIDGPPGNPVGPESLVKTLPWGGTLFSACSDPAGSYAVLWNDYQGGGTTPLLFNVAVRDYFAETMPYSVPLANNQTVTNLSGSAGGWRYFKVTVPANVSGLRIALAPQGTTSSGNADLYVRYAGLPTASTYDDRSTLPGNGDAINYGSVPPGDFYIAVYGQSAYAATSLNVSYY